MTTPPETSSALVPRGGTLLPLVLVVSAGIYFLGHRSHAVAQGADSPTGGAPSNTGRHLAPHDTFYLLQYVSAKTPTGVIGFEPGQQVHLVEVHRSTQTLVVGDGQAQVEVGPEKLTNDMDMAALVRQKDQTNQAKIAAYVQGEQKAYDDSKRSTAIDTAKDIDKINQQERRASTVKSNDSKLDQPATVVAGSAGYGGGYGYGNVGSDSYGSPYSYFSSPATAGAAPAAATGGTARGGVNPATVGH